MGFAPSFDRAPCCITGRTHASLATQGVSNPSEWTTIRLLPGRTVSAVALAQAEGTGFEPVSPEGQRFSRPPG